MPILDDVKKKLRISNTAYDGEVTDLIVAAKSELAMAGIIKVKADDDTDPLIKRAIDTYCKANFGWNNPDADRLRESFESLKNHLSLSVEYNSYAVTFEVTYGTDPVDEAKIVFNDMTKYTGADGKAVFYVREGDNYEYEVSADGYSTVEDNKDISASQTIAITL